MTIFVSIAFFCSYNTLSTTRKNLDIRKFYFVFLKISIPKSLSGVIGGFFLTSCRLFLYFLFCHFRLDIYDLGSVVPVYIAQLSVTFTLRFCFFFMRSFCLTVLIFSDQLRWLDRLILSFGEERDKRIKQAFLSEHLLDLL